MTDVREETAANDEVELRLRRLGSVCVALAAAVLVSAGGLGWRVFSVGGADWRSPAPPVNSFLAAFGGLLLVLLASAAHTRILRVEDTDESDEMGGSEEGEEASWVAARLRAYSLATGVAFGMLALAAALGVGVGTVGGAPFYGLVICMAALFGMLAKWPRRSGFDLMLVRESTAGREDNDEPER